MKAFAQSILAVDLDDLGPETTGDCMRACVASVLEIDPSLLPNPHGEQFGDWGAEWRKALAAFGVQPVWLGRHEEDMKAWWDLGFPGYWLATVKLEKDELGAGDDAEKGIGHHCVVMLMDQLAHDPMPGSPFNSMDPEKLRSKIVHATVFLPVNPKLGVIR